MKDLNVQNVLLVCGVLVLAYALMQYTNRKGSEGLNYGLNNSPSGASENQPILGGLEGDAAVVGEGNASAGAGGDSGLMSNELMPAGDVQSQGLQSNFLSYGDMIGINTVNSSLRNPNLQLRSEPVIPPNPNACAWNMSTIGLQDQVNKEGPQPNLAAAGDAGNL